MLTKNKLQIIQEFNELAHEHYGIELKTDNKGRMRKIHVKTRAVAVGMIYSNIECSQIEIAASLGLSVDQVRHSLKNFDTYLDCQAMAIEFNEVWSTIAKQIKLLTLETEIADVKQKRNHSCKRQSS